MGIVLLGNPNVGKTLIFNRLTNNRELVSNYSGTSMAVVEGLYNLGNKKYKVYDTPGVYSISGNDNKNIIKQLINSNNLVLNVVDATNLERNLVLTYDLKEQGIPTIVILNQIDRARSSGIKIDRKKLSDLLGFPVVFFSATTGEGIYELQELLNNPSIFSQPQKRNQTRVFKINQVNNLSCSGSCSACGTKETFCITDADMQRYDNAVTTANLVTSITTTNEKALLEKVQNWIDKPIVGTVFLLFLTYIGFYVLLKFIEFSEGPLGSLLEPISKLIEETILTIMPTGIVATILAKAVPEGIIIPFTIIMPAMLMVSFLMSVIEDTGLLPRYSVALERAGSFFGLSGQAVIPLSLGFGCRTPAVMATRIMETEAQRFITIALLSIVIPCAATLGILASVIASFKAYLSVIVLAMLLTLMGLGYILSRLMPREETFIYELPPLRLPLWPNVWSKVKQRFSGFFTEILPLLLIMSIAIRALMESGFLEYFNSLNSITKLLFGIPAEAFVAVLITIFQRYLAPLVLLNLPLSPREATIAITMIAMSLPCLPVMVMTVREIGIKGLIKIIGMGFATSFIIGITLNLILPL